MSIRSFFGFGSSTSSSNSGSATGSAGTRTTTSGSGSTGGWHSYDEATAREHHRIAQVTVPSAATDQHGRRVNSPRPRPEDTNRSFWRS
ncbi:hypothetical protein [Kitasatospora phosalacinea]|uniref:Uncharacterized protein n=1 Tax=Kitasatospora phosalacinea TaxID=2065 RepID=A0A9W6US11_9ACTN|nr:hypothetical protein [Kitasatospora phosalacinea]GLW58093.1 hypothetical protein Kpho01_61040 [Kitasatospora phosalacinea]